MTVFTVCSLGVRTEGTDPTSVAVVQRVLVFTDRAVVIGRIPCWLNRSLPIWVVRNVSSGSAMFSLHLMRQSTSLLKESLKEKASRSAVKPCFSGSRVFCSRLKGRFLFSPKIIHRLTKEGGDKDVQHPRQARECGGRVVFHGKVIMFQGKSPEQTGS